MSTGFPVDTGGDVCTAQIDTTIPGSVESVDNAADWLKKLQDGFYDADSQFSSASSTARYTLSDKIAGAAADYADDLHDACDDAYHRAKNAVDNIRSFADQLGWRKDDMAEHRETAIAGGLTVVGNVIAAPTPVSKPADLSKDATAAEKQKWTTANDAYEDYQTKKALFDDISDDVQKTFDKLDDWITDHLVTAESDTLDNVLMDAVITMLQNAGVEAVKTGFGLPYYHKAAALYNRAWTAAEERTLKHSGNPGRKAPKEKTVSERANRSSNTQAGRTLENTGTKVAKGAGTAVTLGFIGYDLAYGESPSETLLTAGASYAAGSATSAAVAATTLESATGAASLAVSAEGATVVAGGGVALASSAALPAFAATAAAVGVGYAYENILPLETRAKIDEGLNDVWDWGADRVDDAGDWISDQWNKAFG